MDKIIDREVAWRIFAHEFNRSNLYFSEGDERAPNYIITPTGVKCNRLFIVGVVTEVENIGHENNLWKARIADPTGVFTVYAGQYQPEAAIFLSELEVPSFVALVGKARKYEPEDGNVYLSIRPEEINLAGSDLRDRWVLDTAERTLERIRDIEEAQASGLSGNELADFFKKKEINPVFADGMVRALRHYDNMEQIISELKTAIINAIHVVAPDASGKRVTGVKKPQMNTIEENIPEKEFTPEAVINEDVLEEIPGETGHVMDEAGSEFPEPEIVPGTDSGEVAVQENPPEPKELIAEILEKLDSGKGVPHSMIVEAALSSGINAVLVESGIKALMAEGRCYEPKIGLLRKV